MPSFNFSDYQSLNNLYESRRTIIYRGVRKRDNLPVILKMLKRDYPLQAELTQYKNEYEITSSLNLKGTLPALGLEQYNNTLVLIFEDVGGTSLKDLLKTRTFTIEEFLFLAISLADILSGLYEKGIIHRDINPSNIILNLQEEKIYLIDFGLARRFTDEITPYDTEGNLLYISPEQTGRTSCSVDYRTDFYSLGVTFYEILTGKVPFFGTDVLALVHEHLAKQSVPPCDINKNVPEVISNITMKLMSKNKEERYQSSWGLKKDLEECIRQLKIKGRILYPFPLGRNDIPSIFFISDKIYGREKEIGLLIDGFDNVCNGKREGVLISGHAGTGKTSLVKEISRYVAHKGGYLISGKFEQMDKLTPYSAIVSALGGLLEKILTEKDEDIAIWKEKFISVFGCSGQLLINILPKLELIIGPQPDVEKESFAEIRNLFSKVFGRFIQVLCEKKHPLVIFLDDIQWADSSSLRLLEFIMIDEPIKYLYFIGSFRDDEAGPLHPLMKTLNLLKSSQNKINEINLGPLEVKDITQLISDTLYSKDISIHSLSDRIKENTGGNPFFVKQYLQILYKEKFLFFNYDNRCWQWELNKISEHVTDNVAELMIQKIKELPVETQKTLQAASFIGSRFDLTTLSVIYDKKLPEIYSILLPAMREGFIVPTSELEPENTYDVLSKILYKNYKFLHDRIQHYIYSLPDLYNHKELNLRIGRQLFYNLPSEELKKRLFEITDYFNVAKSLITDENEKNKVIELNFMSCKRAKKSIAYREALRYIKHGFELLSNNIWKDHYSLAFDFHKEFAEIEYLNGNYEESQKIINIALEQSKSSIEKAELYSLLIVQFTMLARYEEAISIGKKALALFNIDLYEKDLDKAFNEEVGEIKNILYGKDIYSLLDMPLVREPEKKQAIKLLSSISPPSYLTSNKLFSLVTAKKVYLSLKYGNVPESCVGYSTYGLLCCSILGEYKTGYDFGVLGIKLAEKFMSPSLKSKALHIFANNICSMVRHIKGNDKINREGYQAGLDGGDLEYAGYCLFDIVMYYLHMFNKSIKEIFYEMSDYVIFVNKTGNTLGINFLTAIKLILLNLNGLTKDKFSFDTEEIKEEEFINNCHNNRTFAVLCEYNLFKGQIFYLYGRYSEALECIIKSRDLLEYVLGRFSTVEYNFYYSLILAELYTVSDEIKKAEYLEQIKLNQKEMKRFAHNCPENFLHKYLLVEAELFRISGKILEASEHYNLAIEGAVTHEFVKDEALANELAGRFFLRRKRKDYAKIHLKKAHYIYELFGAVRKSEGIINEYREYLVGNGSPYKINRSSLDMFSSSSSSSETLDLETVIKLSQIISGEIILENLINKTMVLLKENAGAQRVTLMLETDGIINIEALIEDNSVTLLKRDIKNSDNISEKIINYVLRTRETVILENALEKGNFIDDPYILKHKVKSLLCMPLIHMDKLTGILYLENNIATGIFTPKKIAMLNILSSQIATSIENSRLYSRLELYNRTLEEKVTEKTKELKDSLEKYKESEENFRKLIDLSPVPIGITNFDITYPATNRKFIDLFGYVLDKPTLDDWWEKAYPDEVYREKVYATWIDAVTEANKSGTEIEPQEVKITCHDGSVKDVELRYMPIGNKGITTFHDITEYKRVEEELTKARDAAQSRLTTAIEQAVDSITILDTDGNIVYVNSASEIISGYTKEELMGQKPFSMLSKNNKGFYKEILDSVKKGKVWSGILTNVKKDGTSYEIECKITPVRDNSGDIINYVTFMEDVTKERMIEKQIRQAQKMEAMGTLAGGIAHDFNNILGVIIGYAEIILFEPSDVTWIEEHVSQLLQACNRAKELVKQILTFCRQSEGEVKPVRVGIILKEALQFLRASVPSTIEMKSNINSTHIMVLADGTQIYQVILNLCTNAVHAMREKGGILEVSLSEEYLKNDEASLYPELNPGRYLKLTVKDTGHGMNRLVMERIFEPFFTTKERGEGTGMGLSVVHGIVSRYGGAITVDSVLGEGTVFNVLFPVIESEAIEKIADIKVLPGGNEQILFVDDEEELVKMNKQVLSKLGYKVVGVTDPREALKLFSSEPHSFDVVITDLTMPKMTGIDLARQLLYIRSDIPVILCTGFSETVTEDIVKKVGIKEFLMKPVIARNLTEAIRRALKKD